MKRFGCNCVEARAPVRPPSDCPINTSRPIGSVSHKIADEVFDAIALGSGAVAVASLVDEDHSEVVLENIGQKVTPGIAVHRGAMNEGGRARAVADGAGGELHA